ncbi:hypothetical protein ABZ930_35625 [Streptomyces sp. NPDC046716]
MTTSEAATANSYGVEAWARLITGGWPWGLRGVIDRPLTLKYRPWKSM